jgi:hypothetical protein
MIASPQSTLLILDYNEWQFDRYLHYKNPSEFPASRHGQDARVPSVNIDGSSHIVGFTESLLAGGYEP